jgi:DNA-binding PadR family transcriptional regulator
LLALYILYSLGKGPRSGYDLLKEIREITRGAWTPSKGSLYPLLHQLEEEGLIAVHDTGDRARTVYERTEKGAEMLRAIRERSRESHRKMILYKDLIHAIFGSSDLTPRRLIFEIRAAIEVVPSTSEREAVALLERCLHDLQELTLR